MKLKDMTPEQREAYEQMLARRRKRYKDDKEYRRRCIENAKRHQEGDDVRAKRKKYMHDYFQRLKDTEQYAVIKAKQNERVKKRYEENEEYRNKVIEYNKKRYRDGRECTTDKVGE